MRGIHQKTLIAALISALVLTGCGGGGGGGGSSGGFTPTVVAQGNPVPFYTPQLVGVTQTLQNGTTTVSGSNESATTFTAKDLTGSGSENVIVTGRAYGPSNPVGSSSSWDNSVISIFGWQNGQLVDQTAQWFSHGDNVIVGTENAPKFGRFGSGRVGMYVAPYTDNNVYGDGAVFINNGSSFTRVNIALGIPISDSVVYDLNGDGVDDIYHQTNTAGVKMSFGASNGTFNTMTNRSAVGAGTSAAIADFMGNGTSSIIVTDSSDGSTSRTRLYSWAITGSDLNLTQISVLPESRFALSRWASYNFGGGTQSPGHDVKALAFDFDNSGLTSAIVISRPSPIPGQSGWPAFSEVQFLKNRGGGVFQDVTDTTLYNYNTNTNASYSPVLADVNNDGLTDIVLSSMTYDGRDTTQVLVHTAEHKYMASYANVITAFQNQAADLQRAVSSTLSGNSNTVAFVRGPDNSLYLVSGVDYNDSGVIKKGIYLSKLGSVGTVTAQATINAIRQAWPWMSDAQANQVLSRSSQTWFGFNVIDYQSALSPIGPLSVNVRGAMQPISGSIGGIALNGAAKTFTTFDTLGRSFNVDYSSSNFNMAHFWSQNISDPVIDDTRSATGMKWTGMQMTQMSIGQAFSTMGFAQNQWGQGWMDEAVIKMGSNQFADMTNPYSGGTPKASYAYAITNVKPFSDRNLALNFQYTNLPFSPFVQMSGVWGQVNSSDMVEVSSSYRYKGLIGKMGVINSYTSMQSGLVNNVTPINSVWAEVGHEWKVVKTYFGMLPKIVSGEANISIPTGVDRMGNTQYTNMNAGVNNPLVGYARVQVFNFTDRARTKSYTVNGMVSTDNNKAIIANYTHRF